MRSFLRKISIYFKDRKDRGGFTVIEAFVGISILLVGIVGPLTLVNDNMQAGRFSRNQITSYYLAQEAVEIIRQRRDDNLLGIAKGTETNWLAGLDSSPNCYNGCRVDGRYGVSDGKRIQRCDDGDPCSVLYTNDNSGEFGHQTGSNWARSRYTRYVELESITSDQVRINVTVTFDAGNYVQEYETVGYISNWIQ